MSSAGFGTVGAGGDTTGVVEPESDPALESGTAISSAGFGAVTVGRDGAGGEDEAPGGDDVPDDAAELVWVPEDGDVEVAGDEVVCT